MNSTDCKIEWVSRWYNIIDVKYKSWSDDFRLIITNNLVRRCIRVNWYLNFIVATIQDMENFLEELPPIDLLRITVYKYKDDTRFLKTYYYSKVGDVEIDKMAFEIARIKEHLTELDDENNYVSMKISVRPTIRK